MNEIVFYRLHELKKKIFVFNVPFLEYECKGPGNYDSRATTFDAKTEKKTARSVAFVRISCVIQIFTVLHAHIRDAIM